MPEERLWGLGIWWGSHCTLLSLISRDLVERDIGLLHEFTIHAQLAQHDINVEIIVFLARYEDSQFGESRHCGCLGEDVVEGQHVPVGRVVRVKRVVITRRGFQGLLRSKI